MSQPLAGLRVVDFSRLLPGPYASLVLADLGAEVIKVEAPRGGDYMRWTPPVSGRFSWIFGALNTGKRSLAVDLKRPEGVAAVRALLDTADVLLESFRPGVMDRLGLGWQTIKERNPRLVYCAISGYGQDGPYRDRAGHDLNYVGLAGLLSQSGPREAPPALPPVQIGDIGGGSLWSLVGILSALVDRERHGEGRFVDVSMTDGSLAFMQIALANHVAGGLKPPPRGDDTLTGGRPFYGVYETADGRHMTLAAIEPKFWKAFCEAVERPDLIARQLGSAQDAEKVRAELVALFAGRTRDAWASVFETVDACCEPVLEAHEIATHPLHVARGNVLRDTDGVQRLRTPIQETTALAPAPAPDLGADSRAILADLGYEAAAIDAMIASGTVKQP